MRLISWRPQSTMLVCMQVWNFDFLNATQGQVYGNASATYETLEPEEANSVYLGILLQASINQINPTNITVNGQQCTLQLVNNITGKAPGTSVPETVADI